MKCEDCGKKIVFGSMVQGRFVCADPRRCEDNRAERGDATARIFAVIIGLGFLIAAVAVRF